MSKKVLIPLAQGFEEAEFIGIADVLKRAEEFNADLEVIIASLNAELLVRGANGISIKADCSIQSVDTENLDAIALAGGFEGMMNLKNSDAIFIYDYSFIDAVSIKSNFTTRIASKFTL